MSDETKKIIEDMGNDIDSLLNSKLTDLSTESIKYMEKVEELKNEAQNRSRSFWGRKKIIDILIMINLAITPIALILISYWIFFKK